ncbi:hypothetical protein E2C01_022008 [Portunus trituberculatus]|uniref:Uncharacterized protein n=1 Tax=Portunus trituberculatus TaxID=210409 RepID=A0A5B7E638_PORTR|nr:hypothetical protein [Portunus trituberculatus]
MLLPCFLLTSSPEFLTSSPVLTLLPHHMRLLITTQQSLFSVKELLVEEISQLADDFVTTLPPNFSVVTVTEKPENDLQLAESTPSVNNSTNVPVPGPLNSSEDAPVPLADPSRLLTPVPVPPVPVSTITSLAVTLISTTHPVTSQRLL